MSSRNRNLSEEERRQALVLFRALLAVQELVRKGERESVGLLAMAMGVLAGEPAVQVDYCRILDPDTLEDIPDVGKGALVAVAARVGTTRLIDNLLI
jgi:pantoate--beta-alanine ligase